MESELTFVGLDVDTRSSVACALDDVTGELTRGRLVPQPEVILTWLRQLEWPIAAVLYEAGATGFGLARFLLGHGIRCVAAAPSKIQRPAGSATRTPKMRCR